MHIAFIVNEISTEQDWYATPALAFSAYKRGHTVYFIGIDQLAYSIEGFFKASCKTVSNKSYKNAAAFLKAIKESDFKTITSKDLDVIMLRNNPSDENSERHWAQHAAFIFAEIAAREHVIVLNHPAGLASAVNKMYFQHFPESIRPKTIITRDHNDIKEFFESENKRMILKPLQGSGGEKVFLINANNEKNLNQTIDAICKDGFVIAQEYLPDAKNGDVRLYLLNGKPIVVNGHYAILRRKGSDDDVRSNVHAGGKTVEANITETHLELAETVRPKLIKDGMFLVGLDIVGDKIMEINVFSPGGINLAGDLYNVDFCSVIIRSIEQKLQYKKTYGNYISNSRIATM